MAQQPISARKLTKEKLRHHWGKLLACNAAEISWAKLQLPESIASQPHTNTVIFLTSCLPIQHVTVSKVQSDIVHAVLITKWLRSYKNNKYTCVCVCVVEAAKIWRHKNQQKKNPAINGHSLYASNMTVKHQSDPGVNRQHHIQINPNIQVTKTVSLLTMWPHSFNTVPSLKLCTMSVSSAVSRTPVRRQIGSVPWLARCAETLFQSPRHHGDVRAQHHYREVLLRYSLPLLDPSSNPSSGPGHPSSGVGRRPSRMACSTRATWQKTYWSGIWILNARWDRTRRTVAATSTRPVSASRRVLISIVMNVPNIHTTTMTTS